MTTLAAVHVRRSPGCAAAVEDETLTGDVSGVRAGQEAHRAATSAVADPAERPAAAVSSRLPPLVPASPAGAPISVFTSPGEDVDVNAV